MRNQQRQSSPPSHITRTRNGKAATGYNNLDRHLNNFFGKHVKDAKGGQQ